MTRPFITIPAGIALGIVTAAAIVLILVSTEAQALPLGIERTVQINAAEQCAHKATGLPIPETPMKVVYSDEWSRDPNGICCDRNGQTAKSSARVLSTYSPMGRTVTMYRGAGFPQLVHEVAADMFVQVNGPWNPRQREEVGYRAEWYAQECPR